MDKKNHTKSYRIRILAFLCIFLLLFPMLIELIPVNNKLNSESEEVLFPKIAENRGEIKIYGNDDFTIENGTRSGTGDSGNPYIISDWNISNPGSGICIEIVNTTKYFEIENCTLSNAEKGIQIQNATNVKIINCSIFEISGIDGLPGVADTNGGNGDKAYGISISNCSYVNITENEIYNIFGGSGGNGGVGSNGESGNTGGIGGNGSLACGILTNKTRYISITYNSILNVLGGNGGNGGIGGGSNDDNGNPGGNGGSGGLGGMTIGLQIIYSNYSDISNNIIKTVKGGTGGTGGTGGNGSNYPTLLGTGGTGGFGGSGAFGGFCIGLLSDNLLNTSLLSNNVSSLWGGLGGNGGNGGMGGNSTASNSNSHGGTGGFGGIGGTGGSVYGFINSISLNITIKYNNFSSIFGGKGGDSGNGGLGGNVNTRGYTGIGGDVSFTGDGGYASGIYFMGSYKINIYSNNILMIIGGNGGNGGNGGLHGNFSIGALGCHGGHGGSGGHAGDGGNSDALAFHFINHANNDYNNISLITAGNGGNGGNGNYGGDSGSTGGIYMAGNGGNAGNGGFGGNCTGIYTSESVNACNYWNDIINITGGSGGIPGTAGMGGNFTGTGDGDGGTGGDGGNGKTGGYSYGIFTINSINLTYHYNIISTIISGHGSSGSDGGNGGDGDSADWGTGGNGGNGGNGSNGGSIFGIKYINSNYTSNFKNNVSKVKAHITGNANLPSAGDGGNGGNGGSGFNYGDGGNGGNAGDGSIGFGIQFIFSNNHTNIWNNLSEVIGTLGGDAGLGGAGGFGGSNGGNGTSGISNIGYGFYLKNSNESYSYQNYIFIENNTNIGGIQNTWNSTTIGNYWAFYTGNDTNDDGIGDIPYSSSGIIDYLPIWDDGPEPSDTTNPRVFINNPANETIWNSPPLINVTVFDPNFDSLWYKVSGTTEPLVNNTEELLTSTIWSSLAEGMFQIEIFANDSAGNLNDTYVLTLYKDTSAPAIIINLPVNQSYWNSPPLINVTVFDPNFDSLWYKVGGTTEPLVNNTEELLTSTIWNSLAEGMFQIEIFANDSVGNLNDTYVLTLYKDTLVPNVIINIPDDQTYWDTPPLINITAFDLNFDSLWYRVGGTTEPLVNNTEELLTSTIWNSLAEGMFQIEIFANDSAGNLNDTYVLTLYKDTSAPAIIINLPVNQSYWNSPPPISITVIEANLDSLWYRVGGITELLENNTQELLTSAIWNTLAEGMFQIEIFANDSIGNLNDTYVLTLYKDTLVPNVIINIPDDQTYWDTPPLINITAFDLNFDSLWYRVGGTTEPLVNNTEELLTSTIWNSLAEGMFQIEIFANDSARNLNDTYIITLYKDTLEPSITINSPLSGERFGSTAPSFSLTIFDPTLNTTFYALYNGTQWSRNITFSGLTGVIDQTLWDSLSEGEIIICFYANDSYGRIGYKNITIFKELPGNGGGGFDPMLFIILIGIIGGIVTIGAIIIIKKRGTKKEKDRINKIISSINGK